MLKNYFLVAWRNLTRNKIISVINIGGLAIGLAACWIIALYVGNELSYDRYHANANRIYRIVQHGEWNGGGFNLALTSAPFAPAFKSYFPEVKETVRINLEGGGTITYNEKHVKANDIAFADSNFFHVFTYHFLYGDASALEKPEAIVISKTLAEKIFGDASVAMGKTISFGKQSGNLVTGVIDDVPVNSHFTFSAIRHMPPTSEDWGSVDLYTYILLNNETDIRKVEAKIPGFFNRYLKVAMDGVKYKMELQPLTAIHLHSNLDYEMQPNGSMRYILIFSFVALLILIIASINYMNLSTARSALRVKEIGVRKVNGSSRGQLIAMFLAESVLLTFFAAILAAVLVQISQPLLQQFTGKDTETWQLGMWQTLSVCGGLVLVIGCLSGIYPALFLSGFKLIPSLKGQAGKHMGNLRFRQSLVVFQFVITIAMISGSIIIYQQLKYVRNTSLGFNKDQVLSFHLSNEESRNKVDVLKSDLLKNPLIESVASAGNPIGNNNIGGRDYMAQQENGKMSDAPAMANVLMVDEDFVSTLQVKMGAGRNFSTAMGTDKYNMLLVNETLAKKEGWTNPIGKKIQLGKDKDGKPNIFEVAGVMKDFNIYSLQHKIEPLIVQLPLSNGDKDNIYVRVSNRNVSAAIKYIESVYRQLDTENPFEYNFLDENFARQYRSERMQGNLLMTFTILAIVIACLGLFGLIAFAAEQRRKEMGIRKVLGSSVSGIVLLLCRDLLKLVVIAIVIATPIAWVFMNKWLQDFAYRIHIAWWVFAGAGVLALLIAIVTVSVQAIKAATANQMNALRSE